MRPGRTDEFVKKLHQGLPQHILSKIKNFFRGKNYPKHFGFICHLKTAQMCKQLPNLVTLNPT
jgi:hypothetical protein